MKYYDWQIRLEAFLRARQSVPFAWGTNDCVIFAADCVQALTGVDHVPPKLRGASLLQSARILKERGGVIALAAAALGEPLPAAFAQIGDVVLCKAGDQDMLGICNGSTALAPGPDGLVSVALGALCWRTE